MIQHNLQLIYFVFIIFILSVCTNIMASSFYNVHTLKEHFSIQRFLTGIIKMFIVGISTGLLAIIATLLPELLSYAGIEMSEDMQAIYSVLAIVALYINGILKYYKSAFMTIKDIIENKTFIEDADENVTIDFENEVNNDEF